MGLFSFFRSDRPSKKKTPSPKQRNSRRLELEPLEARFMPSCNTISGYVYHDVNNNGVFDVGEAPIAGSTVQLLNSSGIEVARAVSDANGYYEFAYDQTISGQQQTITQTAEFSSKDNPTDTNFTLTDTIEQFDPALGQLLSVSVMHEGEVTSIIKVENTSTTSDSEIHAQVGGKLTLSVVGGSITSQLTLSENAGDFTADTYDGATDYAGDSGHTFLPAVSAYDSVTFTLTPEQMQAFIGTGLLTLQEKAVATSFASGGGNLDVKLNSKGWGKATIVYTYIPNNCLQPGDYTIKQLTTPAEYPLDGKETRDGVPMNNPVNVSIIPVTLVEDVDLVNNNFGEMKPVNVSGHVYHDSNNNGVMETGETRLSGVTVTLTGVNDLGQNITPIVTSTDSNGFYKFENLRPGTYTITESQPSTHLDGKDTIGTKPAQSIVNDTFIGIKLNSGESSINNNFGELLPASLSGYVYVDADDDGIKDGGEAGIAGVTVTLTGTNDNGTITPIVATTDANGFYKFSNLRPGTYTITETHPTAYKDGKDTAGTPVGSSVANDLISTVILAAGINGENNNFGELEQADLAIDKTANKETTSTGEQLTYTLVITNHGAHAAQNVVVRDTLPPGATLVSSSLPANLVNGVLTFNLGTLPVNGTATITVIITTPSTEGAITNTGVVSSSTFDPNLSNNQDSVVTPVILVKADLAIQKIASDDEVSTGQEMSYTLIVTNLGTNTANNVVVTDNLPPGATFVSATADGWTQNRNGGVLTFTTGEMAAGAFKIITITIKAPATAGVFVNSTVVTSSTFDPDLSNNQDSVSTLATAEQADLSIDKAVNHDEVKTGEQITYTLIVTNLGTYTAKNVTVTDTLPTGAVFVSASASGWVQAQGNGLLVFSTSELAVGASKVITITIKAPTVAGVIVNLASVTSETPDNNLENNHDFAVTTVTSDGQTFPKTLAPFNITVTIPQILGKIKATNAWSATDITSRRAQHAFIDGVIRSLLGRPSTMAEQSNYYNMMQGGMTREQFVLKMWNSDEHYALQAEGYYETFYHRPPTAAEKAQLISLLKSGINEMQVAYQFLTSAEYLNAHSTAETFVRGFYQDVLGQVPSTNAQNLWVNAMGVGTVQSVALNMLNSTDVMREIVDVAFANTLHRWATEQELQFWTSELQNNRITPGELMKKLLASSEFFSLTFSLMG